MFFTIQELDCIAAVFFYFCKIFFKFKKFELYWGTFFKILFTHLHDFLSQIAVAILITPKKEAEQKNEWFCGVKLFRSNFKGE